MQKRSLLFHWLFTIAGACIPSISPDDRSSSSISSTTIRICPTGWVEFNNFCYFFSGPSNKKNWMAAEAQCNSMGSKLASIHSPAENNFILMLTTQMTTMSFPNGLLAIGVRRNVSPPPPPYNFYNIDGTPLDYTNWFPGQPDNSAGAGITEACVQLFSDNLFSGQLAGTWNDVDCTMMMQYICKM